MRRFKLNVAGREAVRILLEQNLSDAIATASRLDEWYEGIEKYAEHNKEEHGSVFASVELKPAMTLSGLPVEAYLSDDKFEPAAGPWILTDAGRLKIIDWLFVKYGPMGNGREWRSQVKSWCDEAEELANKCAPPDVVISIPGAATVSGEKAFLHLDASYFVIKVPLADLPCMRYALLAS